MSNRDRTKRTISDALNNYSQARATRRELYGPDLVDTVADVADIVTDRAKESVSSAYTTTKSWAMDKTQKASEMYNKRKENWRDKFKGMATTMATQKSNFMLGYNASKEMRAQRQGDRQGQKAQFFGKVAEKSLNLGKKLGKGAVKSVVNTVAAGKNFVNRTITNKRQGTGLLAAATIAAAQGVTNKLVDIRENFRDNSRKTIQNGKEDLADKLEQLAEMIRGRESTASQKDYTDVFDAIAEWYLSSQNEGREAIRDSLQRRRTQTNLMDNVLDTANDRGLTEFAEQTDEFWNNRDLDPNAPVPTSGVQATLDDIDNYLSYEDQLRDLDARMADMEARYAFLQEPVIDEQIEAESVVNGSAELTDSQVESVETLETPYDDPEFRQMTLQQLDDVRVRIHDAMATGYGLAEIDDYTDNYNMLRDELESYYRENPSPEADEFLNNLEYDNTLGSPSFQVRNDDDFMNAQNAVRILKGQRDEALNTDLDRAIMTQRSIQYYENGLDQYEKEQQIGYLSHKDIVELHRIPEDSYMDKPVVEESNAVDAPTYQPYEPQMYDAFDYEPEPISEADFMAGIELADNYAPQEEFEMDDFLNGLDTIDESQFQADPDIQL